MVIRHNNHLLGQDSDKNYNMLWRMWELSRLWCYIVDSPGLNPATNIKSCLFIQRSDIGITFHCEQIKCRNAQSGLRIRHIKCRNTQSLPSARTRQIKCRNTQSLHSAHDRSIVAIHNLFTAHTADQVSQCTSPHCAHGGRSVPTHLRWWMSCIFRLLLHPLSRSRLHHEKTAVKKVSQL